MLGKAPLTWVPAEMMLEFRLPTSLARARGSGQPRPPARRAACPPSPPGSAGSGPRAREQDHRAGAAGDRPTARGKTSFPPLAVSFPEAPRGRWARGRLRLLRTSAPGHRAGPTAGGLTCSPVSWAAGSAAGHGFRFGTKPSPLVAPGNVPHCRTGCVAGDRPDLPRGKPSERRGDPGPPATTSGRSGFLLMVPRVGVQMPPWV